MTLETLVKTLGQSRWWEVPAAIVSIVVIILLSVGVHKILRRFKFFRKHSEFCFHSSFIIGFISTLVLMFFLMGGSISIIH